VQKCDNQCAREGNSLSGKRAKVETTDPVRSIGPRFGPSVQDCHVVLVEEQPCELTSRKFCHQPAPDEVTKDDKGVSEVPF
jgi:hypothetical protein